MVWEQALGVSVLVLMYARAGWMILHPRHARTTPQASAR